MEDGGLTIDNNGSVEMVGQGSICGWDADIQEI
jgi:hypothetical protein